MKYEITRSTTRTITGLDIPGLTIPKDYASTVFKPTQLTEVIEQTSDEKPVYSVRVTGPVILKSGQPHANQRADRTYGGWRSEIKDLPEELAALCVGQSALMRVTL